MSCPSKSWRERSWRRAQLHKLGFKMWEYERYLETTHWQQFRKQILQAQRNRLGGNYCERCEAPQETSREAALHLHHITYERLGEELPEDVQIVCRSCHDKEHGRGK